MMADSMTNDNKNNTIGPTIYYDYNNNNDNVDGIVELTDIYQLLY